MKEGSENIFDVLIIGGGPAGYAAAIYAAGAGLSVMVFEMLSPGGQMATAETVGNYPGFGDGISGFDLGMRMSEQAKSLGAVTKFAKVTKAELKGDIKRVYTAKEVFEGRTVILAMGAAPRKLALKGEDELVGKGVSYCATCDGTFYRGKVVAVAGGGDTAADDALYLARICEEVHLIHRRDAFRASRAYMDAIEKTGNIKIHRRRTVSDIYADDFVTGVRLKNTETGEEEDLACDGLFVAVGTVANSELVKDALELDDTGRVMADETTKTSIPGVYVAGDLRTKPLRQISTAVADGAVAAKCAQEYIAGR